MNANYFTDFGPISLTNACYKVISKLLANKLKVVLHKIISPSQIVFIEGRWINENGVLAREVMHTMNNSKSKKGWAALKIAFLKAFDRMKWSFIEQILTFSTPTFSMLINGSSAGFSHPVEYLDKVTPSHPTFLSSQWKYYLGCFILLNNLNS